MITGVFSPVINLCGGGEWVAINIIDALKEHGHQVIILTDTPLNQNKFANIFNRKVSVDRQIVFPLAFFRSRALDYHNIYTDAIRSLMLKFKCEVLIDTYSNAILPGTDVSYVHYPLLKRVESELPYIRNKIYFYAYRSFLNFRRGDINHKLIFANSKFTAEAVKAEFGVDAHILYPPVSSDILNHNETDFNGQRDNTVTTIARISKEKNLKIIPYIAKSTSKEVSFIITGLLNSKEVLNSLLRLIRELRVSEKVKILTNVKRDRLIEILRNSKVYLHPAINEHFGISIIEAMSSGCLPVVHNSGGPKEFVPKHFRYKSIEEAARKVEKAIESWSPKEARRISKFADRFSENNFSKRFIDIFNSYFR
ncbi:MAG: glycosyltransferase [archaeon]|nr:glycosyltransferase [archaeon]